MLGLVESIERTEKKIDRWLPQSPQQQKSNLDWQPLLGPQLQALECEADELFYGGAAGGGKSDLLLGCAFTQHKRSAIFRRIYPNLHGLIERSIEITGDEKRYNKTEKVWRVNNRVVEFGAVQYEADKKNWQGRPHDLYGFDEITEFTKTQYRFIITWNRTTAERQRCRVICTGNPPIDEAGSWVIEEWGPWLDPTHPDKAESGELRWYCYDEDNIIWLRSPDPIELNGEMVYPRSRTFIPARLEDNPYLMRDNAYKSVLQSLPEPLRSQFLKGDFTAGASIDPFQVIPTEWVRLAQKRWIEREKPTTPLTAVGIDPARGGRDKTAMAKRYDNWFDTVAFRLGIQTKNGPAVAAFAHQEIGEVEPGYINVDVIGIGSSAFDSLEPMFKRTYPFNGSEASDYRDKSGRLKMRNKRAESYWRMRDALDPNGGDDVALPPGNEVLADLCAARYEVTTAGVKIEEKEDIKERIGRSPDIGEAIIMANMPPNSKWRSIEFVKV